jgi:hypothetical protein
MTWNLLLFLPSKKHKFGLKPLKVSHQYGLIFQGLCRLSGVPDLPEARGKLCAAYDPSGALIGLY